MCWLLLVGHYINNLPAGIKVKKYKRDGLVVNYQIHKDIIPKLAAKSIFKQKKPQTNMPVVLKKSNSYSTIKFPTMPFCRCLPTEQ